MVNVNLKCGQNIFFFIWNPWSFILYIYINQQQAGLILSILNSSRCLHLCTYQNLNISIYTTGTSPWGIGTAVGQCRASVSDAGPASPHNWAGIWCRDLTSSWGMSLASRGNVWWPLWVERAPPCLICLFACSHFASAPSSQINRTAAVARIKFSTIWLSCSTAEFCVICDDLCAALILW